MNSVLIRCMGLGLMVGLVQAVQAQSMASSLGVIAYPPEDRSAEEISGDESHCYNWAVDYTGIDPLSKATQQAAQEPEQQRGGQAARGAVVGAAAGVLIGDNRESAATGAAVGAVGGGIARRRQDRAHNAQQQQAQQESQSQMDKFRMGFGSCLTARGYTVQ